MGESAALALSREGTALHTLVEAGLIDVGEQSICPLAMPLLCFSGRQRREERLLQPGPGLR